MRPLKALFLIGALGGASATTTHSGAQAPRSSESPATTSKPQNGQALTQVSPVTTPVPGGVPAPITSPISATPSKGNPTEDAQRFRQNFGLPATPAAIAAAAAGPDSRSIAEYGVPLLPREYSELHRRRELEKAAGPLQAVVSANEDVTGGMYIDQQRGGEFVVRLLPGAPAAVASAIRAALPPSGVLRFEPATYSTVQLQQFATDVTKSFLDFTARGPVPTNNVFVRLKAAGLEVASLGPDIPKNRVKVGFVTLSTQDAQTAASIWDLAVSDGIAPPRVAMLFEEVGALRPQEDRDNSPGQLKSGLALSDRSESCTSNLSVTEASGIQYRMTAGHCFGNNLPIIHGATFQIGVKSSDREFNGSDSDVSLIRQVPGGLSSPYAMAVFDCGGFPCRSPQIDTISSYRTNAAMTVGNQVCVGGIGSITVRCGAITQKGQTVVGESVTYTNQVFTNISGTQKGDSGGLVGFGSVAFGIHSAGTGVLTTFTPMQSALNATRTTLLTAVPPNPASWALDVARHSGKCLDLAAGNQADLTGIIHWGCHGLSNQRWTFVPTSGPSGPEGAPPYQIRYFPNPSRCIDVEGSSLQNQARVQIYGCHSGNNQSGG